MKGRHIAMWALFLFIGASREKIRSARTISTDRGERPWKAGSGSPELDDAGPAPTPWHRFWRKLGASKRGAGSVRLDRWKVVFRLRLLSASRAGVVEGCPSVPAD
jgi:hypothetical protein